MFFRNQYSSIRSDLKAIIFIIILRYFPWPIISNPRQINSGTSSIFSPSKLKSLQSDRLALITITFVFILFRGRPFSPLTHLMRSNKSLLIFISENQCCVICKYGVVSFIPTIFIIPHHPHGRTGRSGSCIATIVAYDMNSLASLRWLTEVCSNLVWGHGIVCSVTNHSNSVNDRRERFHQATGLSYHDIMDTSWFEPDGCKIQDIKHWSNQIIVAQRVPHYIFRVFDVKKGSKTVRIPAWHIFLLNVSPTGSDSRFLNIVEAAH